ncbi:hypothetical protein EDB83DRAFT_2328448 [Lactarius deliciosus]|nr:hypothetical protein EDB83DRAFT_2328448 [Lactarius deliciosus]
MSYNWNAPFGSLAWMPLKLFLGDLSWNMILPIFPGSWVRCTGLSARHFQVFPLCSACHHPRRGNRSMRVRIMHSRTLHEGLRGLNLVMLVVSSVQFSRATGHAMPLLVQLIRVFTGKVGSLDRPSSYPIEFKIPRHKRADRLSFTVITVSLIGDAVLIWRLWMIWGCIFCVRSHRLHFPYRPCYLSPTDTIFLSRVPIGVTWVLWIAM